MSGGGGGQNTTVKDATPWGPQQPYLLQMFEEAKKNYESGNPRYYPGNTVAAQSPWTAQAQKNLATQAAPQAGQLGTAAAKSAEFNLTDARDVRSNPYLQRAIEGAIRPTVQSYTDVGGIMYDIGDQALGAGQYGGVRQGVSEGIARGRLTQTVGDIASKMASEGYESGLDAATKTQAFVPGIQQGLSTEAKFLDAAGQADRAYEQQLINAEMDKWNWEQNLPAQKLDVYKQGVVGAFGGSSTASTSGGQMNPVMGAAGGAMTGYALGSYIAGGTAAGGIYGAAAGAILGLIMSS